MRDRGGSQQYLATRAILYHITSCTLHAKLLPASLPQLCLLPLLPPLLVAAAATAVCWPPGFSPSKVLPVVIDVGTDNESLCKDDFYMGLRQPRLQGKEYLDILDEVAGCLWGGRGGTTGEMEGGG